MKRIGAFGLAGLIALAAAGPVEAQKSDQGQSGQTGNTSGQKGSSGGISQTPWFSNQGVQKQLNLNADQTTQLNKAYGQAYNTYQSGMKQLGSDTNLSAQDRAQKMRDLEANFYKSFSTATNDTLTDPAARQRFNQLSWQYRGYGAFNDPMIQEKLKLTPEQQQKLGQFNQEWSKQMNDLGTAYSKDPTAAGKQFTDLRKQYDDRLNSVLNQQQQQTWRQMIGEPYNFEPSAYFQGSTGTSGSPGGTTKN